MHHDDARIIGNVAGLTELRDTINNALMNKRAARTQESDPLFASDGEGYSVRVECHDDDWGMKAPKDSYWNKPKSNPRYTDYL